MTIKPFSASIRGALEDEASLLFAADFDAFADRWPGVVFDLTDPGTESVTVSLRRNTAEELAEAQAEAEREAAATEEEDTADAPDDEPG